MTGLCNFAGFDFGFEELEDIDCTLVVEATFGVVEFGKFCRKAFYLKLYVLCHNSLRFKSCMALGVPKKYCTAWSPLNLSSSTNADADR